MDRDKSSSSSRRHKESRDKSSERNRRDKVSERYRERDRHYDREDSVERGRKSNKRKERPESEEPVEEPENGKRRFQDGRMSKEYDHLKNHTVNAAVSSANGAAVESASVAASNLPQISMVPSHPTSSQVSSITTTNENTGNNSNRSHEVPGQSSTDGTASDAGKTRGLSSLDALAKAKRALQNKFSEKLKKISALSKVIDPPREGSSKVRSNEGVTSMSTAPRISPTPGLPVTSGGSVTSSSLPTSSASMNMPPSGLPNLPGLTPHKYEAVKKVHEFVAKLGYRQDPQFGPLINMFPGQMPPDVTIQPKPAKTPVLRLDAHGREVDEHGNVLDTTKPNNLSTLKVNINKQKKDAFQILKPELEVDPEKNPFFDPDMGINKNKILRPKRMTFQFVEEGKWAKDAEIIKMKNQFGEARSKELKVKQAQLAKAKAEPDINPNLIEVSERAPTKEKPTKDPIPEVEWW
ncbi:hypothetical protein Leryth_008650 [Lithospermum erythrorhizon]|nr:hypothetical protein Leryth_008650 [Lithospermum erythrorhizon]